MSFNFSLFLNCTANWPMYIILLTMTSPTAFLPLLFRMLLFASHNKDIVVESGWPSQQPTYILYRLAQASPQSWYMPGIQWDLGMHLGKRECMQDEGQRGWDKEDEGWGNRECMGPGGAWWINWGWNGHPPDGTSVGMTKRKHLCIMKDKGDWAKRMRGRATENT